MILVSIVTEEFAIVDIINLEKETLQYLLNNNSDWSTILEAKESFHKTLEYVLKQETILLNKLDRMIELININVDCNLDEE